MDDIGLRGDLACVAPNDGLHGLKHLGGGCRVGLHRFEQTEAVASIEHGIDNRLWPGCRRIGNVLRSEHMPDTTPKPLAALIERYLAQGDFAGVAVLAARDGELMVEHYAGQAAPSLPVTRETLWPIASISKVYTAAAIMRLVELGELTLNTPVTILLPEFRGQGREDVRLRHLLTHSAGMIYESPQMEERLRNQVPLEELLAEAMTSTRNFKP
jgi:CubicO group peptidase (beta-lactamase class C family)